MDAEAAHSEALGALADALQDVIALGQAGQDVAVEVRDELGPVLRVTALLASEILRKQ
jgi:hypothetical protein